MADEKNQVKESDDKSSDPNSSGVISLEDIDKFLEENDPEFTMALNDIVPEELESDIPIETLALDDKTLSEDDEAKAKDGSSAVLERYPRVQESLEKVLAPIKSIPSRSRTWGLKVRNEFLSLALSLWSFLRNDLPQWIKFFHAQLKRLLNLIFQALRHFWSKSWKEKLIYLIASLLFIGFFTLVKINLSHTWWPVLFQDYVHSLGQVSDRIVNYKEGDETLLNESFPQPDFTVLLDKIVLNLRGSSTHSNPMGAFKFYVRADSNETAIEIKDRQIEMLDHVQRALEELTYEEVNGPGGKTIIKSLVRKEINQIVNQGRVLDVFIEMMITKP